MTGYRYLAIERTEDVLRVMIDRPEQRNPLSTDVLAELWQVFTESAGDKSLRAAIITGAGEKSFAAGGDLKEFDKLRSAEDAERLWTHANSALRAVREFPLPVIAMLNGVALGGGAELAVSCDFRIAAAHAAIGFVQGRMNICTGFGGGADLVALVGGQRALSILLRAEILTAEQAHEIGLVDEISGVDESLESCVERFLEPIRAHAPQVLRAFKAIAMGERLSLGREQREQRERQAFVATWIHPDHWQASERFLSRSNRGVK